MANIAGIPEEWQAVLWTHLEKYYPDVSLSETTNAPVWHIAAEMVERSLFKKSTVRNDFFFILHEGILFEVSVPGKGKPYARVEPMQGVRVVDYEQTSAYKMIPECGVNLVGVKGSDGQAGERFIGLTDDAPSLEFRVALRAIAN